MTHTVRWYTPSHIIYLDIEGDIALDDLATINQDLMHLLNEENVPVYLFVDDTKVGKFPLQLRKIQSEFEFLRHSSVVSIVGIGKVNPLKKYFIPMVAKITNTNFIRRNTFDDALAFLESQDASIQDLMSST